MTPRDPLTLQRQLAGLATLEASVRTALRGLHVAYPALVGARFHDDPELTTARILIQLCDETLTGIDELRRQVSARLRTLQHPDQTAWPF
jgi:hypothetical protein